MLKIKKISDYLKKDGIKLIDTNIYVVSDEKDAAVIDAGGGVDLAIKYLKENNLNLKYIFLTHAHFDHIYELDKLKEEYIDAKVVASHNTGISDEEMNMLYTIGEKNRNTKIDILVKDKDVIFLNKFEKAFVDKDIKERLNIKTGENEIDFGKDEAISFKVIETPGHTYDSICFLMRYKNKSYLFSGDTIFKDSIGRTDFCGGSNEYMVTSLRKLKREVNDAIVFPGHGENTKFKEWKNVFRRI